MHEQIVEKFSNAHVITPSYPCRNDRSATTKNSNSIITSPYKKKIYIYIHLFTLLTQTKKKHTKKRGIDFPHKKDQLLSPNTQKEKKRESSKRGGTELFRVFLQIHICS